MTRAWFWTSLILGISNTIVGVIVLKLEQAIIGVLFLLIAEYEYDRVARKREGLR